MSQEKVDKYKAEKANRKKEVAKKKLQKKLYVILGVVISLAFVAWIGISVYLEIKTDRENESKAAEWASIYEQMMQEAATATTSSSDATTSSGDETTSAGDETTASGEASTDETTSGEDETTTLATEE